MGKENKIPIREPDFYLPLGGQNLFAETWLEKRDDNIRDIISRVELKDDQEVVYVERILKWSNFKQKFFEERLKEAILAILAAIAKNYVKPKEKNQKEELEKIKAILNN